MCLDPPEVVVLKLWSLSISPYKYCRGVDRWGEAVDKMIKERESCVIIWNVLILRIEDFTNFADLSYDVTEWIFIA